MPLLVTSAAGANGDGYGALLAFGRDGRLLGKFSDDARIADPRGLTVFRAEELLFLNSGSDRVLAFDPGGTPLQFREVALFHPGISDNPARLLLRRGPNHYFAGETGTIRMRDRVVGRADRTTARLTANRVQTPSLLPTSKETSNEPL